MAKFKLLHAIFGFMVNLTLAQVKEKFLSWENKMEIESDDIAGKQVAHFAGSESRHNQKRKFVKKVKSVRDVDQAFVAIQGYSSYINAEIKPIEQTFFISLKYSR